MDLLTLQSTFGGLLHDIGKAVYRAEGQRGSHSVQGYQFLHGVLTGPGWGPMLDCVRYPPRRRAARRTRRPAAGFARMDRVSGRRPLGNG